jgi:hypothetical protein
VAANIISLKKEDKKLKIRIKVFLRDVLKKERYLFAKTRSLAKETHFKIQLPPGTIIKLIKRIFKG